MFNSNKKFIVLAILGALIISAATYLFVNSYLEKTEIIVLKNDIYKGETIKTENIESGFYYKNSLPKNYIKTSSEVIGKEINIDRLKGDYITVEMFSSKKEDNPYKNLKNDEIIISINLEDEEKISDELLKGRRIIIVSTEKDKDLYDLFLNSVKNKEKDIFNSELNKELYSDSSEGEALDLNSKKNYLDSSIFKISENIFLIDGYLLFENIEIIAVSTSEETNTNILINSNYSKSLLVKCSVYEAPYLAKITSKNNYKILIGKNNV